MSELAADQLLEDKYRIIRLIGQGAWATVYEAINVRIQRRVAVKILNVELALHPELLERFNREAEAATQIDSPYIVSMFDAGSLPDGRPFIVMEYLEGEDLAARMRATGVLPDEQAASYAIQLLSGLADAHATGVLHRDIKPDNMIIVRAKNGEEIVKLVDFGISKPRLARPEALSVTRADAVLGSPVYMSPEQARGMRHVDHRSDLYSVGVVLYEALTQQFPHDAESFNELMFKVALEDAPNPRSKRPGIDPDLADIVTRSLAREPDHRFQSAVAFRDALLAWLEARGAVPPPSPYGASDLRLRAADSSSKMRAFGQVGVTRSGTQPKVVVGEIPTPRAPAHPSGVPEADTVTLTPAPELSQQRPLVPIVLAILLVASLTATGILMFRRPRPAITVATTAPLPPPSAIAIPIPTAEPVPSASIATTTPSAAPSIIPTTTARPAVTVTVRPVVPPSRPSAAATAGATSTSTSTPTAAPSASTNAVVEGRSIRTTF